MTSYSNPRMYAEIPNWPMGGSKRGTATFSIEQRPGKGERGVRVTKCNGTIGKPKVLTFARQARIVDGDDGRTYIAELSSFGFISIMRSDMQLQQEVIHERDASYPAAARLFE